MDVCDWNGSAFHGAAGSSETRQPVIEPQERAAWMSRIKGDGEIGLAGIAMPPAVAVGVMFCLLLLLCRFFSKRRKQKRGQGSPADLSVRLDTLCLADAAAFEVESSSVSLLHLCSSILDLW